MPKNPISITTTKQEGSYEVTRLADGKVLSVTPKNPNAVALGSIKSSKKKKTSAENGKKGGHHKPGCICGKHPKEPY